MDNRRRPWRFNAETVNAEMANANTRTIDVGHGDSTPRQSTPRWPTRTQGQSTSAMESRRQHNGDYKVAIVCAIEFEMSAIRYMLDEEHPALPSSHGDSNDYVLGKLCGHQIVLACLPGNQGKSAAATVATNLERSFPSIKWRFLAGIGGGVPSDRNDIRLGDVVVSMPEGQYGGVVQYDLGKDTDAGFKLKGFLSAPPARLRAAVNKMRSDHRLDDNKIDEFVNQMLQRGKRGRLSVYRRPAGASDILFDANYAHPPDQPSCTSCDRSKVVTRPLREWEGSEIHYGLIASGDRVMRSAVQRSLYVRNVGDILCFEMEAAGLATDLPYIVIRGISDYADSHKNDAWQHYAAAAAAAVTKEFLTYLEPEAHVETTQAERSPPYGRNDLDGRANQNFHSSFTGTGVQNVGTGNFTVGGNMHINDSGGSAGGNTHRYYPSHSTSANEAYGKHESMINPLKFSQVDVKDPTHSGYETHRMDQNTLTANSQDPDEMDKVRTQVFDESFISRPSNHELIAKLANTLLDGVIMPAILPQVQIREKLSKALPDLLKAFSLKVGNTATKDLPQEAHRDIMFFIRKNRHEIADEFESCISKQFLSKDPAMSYQELVDKWLPDARDDFITINDKDKDQKKEADDRDRDESGDEEEDNPDPQIARYEAAILKMEALEWLRQCLNREVRLCPAEPNTLDNIRKDIVKSLPSNSKVHRRAPPPVHDVTIEVNWDVTLFLEQQNYGCELSEALPTVITLTGTPNDAMATTADRYMMQTWPKTGEVTLKLIQDILGGKRDRQYFATFFDGTELRAFPDVEDSKTLKIAITGTVASIAEVAEQLAWLGSALRSSQESGLHACVAQIRPTRTEAGAKQAYILDFAISKVEITQDADGQCWHDLFMAPMLATGFPIPYRNKSNTGIEMPLDLMASLVGSDKIDYFEQKALIKGFSALLTPNYRSNDTLFWHLSVNKTGGRVSYPIGSTLGIVGITYNDIKDLRHVVGWCGSARFNAGLKGASYEVVGSTFPELHSHPASANASIHQGDQILCSSSFRHGARDKSIHCAADTYLEKLKWIKEQLVVLWDEEDKRGWLVNGASALLHLVRASLRYESIDRDEGGNLLFQDGHIQEEQFYWAGATAAYHVLVCPENREISLYNVRDARTLEERIIKHYRDLEKAFDLQRRLLQYETRQTLSQSTEQSLQSWAAWDFAGLAKYSGPFSPKLATIQAGHLDWLDFLGENLGITLVGNGFGEIIKPDSDSFCEDWSQLPKANHYLAASRLDIRMVTDRHPERKYVFKGVGGSLVSCRCPDAGRHNSLNPLQPHPSPHSPESPTTKSGLEKLRGDGAIIFDQSTILVSGKDTDPQVGDWSKSNIEHAATPNRKRKANRKDFCQRDLQHSAKKQNLHTLRHADYRVAIICPLIVEMTAVRCMFDEEVERQSSNAFQTPDDPNDYILGKIGGHHVVLTWLRGRRQGKSAAAGVASNLQRTFRHVQWCFLVGIGGGNPSSEHDIHLGDVVVAEPDKCHWGVVQYDLGRETDNGFELKGSLGPPPDKVLNALFRMQSDHLTQKGNKIDDIVATMIAKDTEGLAQYMRPDPEMDILFHHDSKHEPGQDTCLSCDRKRIVPRSHQTRSKIHYGLVASGDSVMRSAERREIQSRNAGSDVLCFEMEAAGVLTVLPCTVIRGISDYADSHKNDKWHPYAAAAAAAVTRMLLIDYLIP